MDDHFCKEKSCSVIRIMPKALKKYITNIDIDNEEIVITDAPKESLDVANIEDDLPSEDDPSESNPT